MATTVKDVDTGKVSARVARVIELFDQEGADPKAIAKKLRFEDHRDLGRFMKLHGFVWSTERGNYVRERDETGAQAGNPSAEKKTQRSSDGAPPLQEFTTSQESLEYYLPLLRFLSRHQERLQVLLQKGPVLPQPGAIPRYAVPGVLVTKSVHMSHDLDMMVRNFSKEKNISQREVFEVALVEFFQRYGYAHEVRRLLEAG